MNIWELGLCGHQQKQLICRGTSSPRKKVCIVQMSNSRLSMLGHKSKVTQFISGGASSSSKSASSHASVPTHVLHFKVSGKEDQHFLYMEEVTFSHAGS